MTTTKPGEAHPLGEGGCVQPGGSPGAPELPLPSMKI